MSNYPPMPPKVGPKKLLINRIIYGDNIEEMRKMPAKCIDTIITDPPYGIGFMGEEWDAKVPLKIWKECLRIAKPGAFMLVFGGTRTYHRLACAIEDAGWQIRDCMMWLYGSGFPKSHNIGKAIDKLQGNEREVVAPNPNVRPNCNPKDNTLYEYGATGKTGGITTPTTALAKLWDGYGTALKPAWEPIVVAMKPLDGTFAQNAEKWGVAGLNIDRGRIRTKDKYSYKKCGGSSFSIGKGKDGTREYPAENHPQGRWPANLLLDEEAAAILDEQSGDCKSSGKYKKQGKWTNPKGGKIRTWDVTYDKLNTYAGQSGGPSRFFYCAKASKKERNAGLGDNLRNNHPTVKPLQLMKYLCGLLKMPGDNQTILDPFAGSGTTCIAASLLGINYIGIEKEQEYVEIAKKRIIKWLEIQSK